MEAALKSVLVNQLIEKIKMNSVRQMTVCLVKGSKKKELMNGTERSLGIRERE